MRRRFRQRGASAIGLDYFLPAEDLRHHIASYYLFRADLPRVTDVLSADLAQIRFLIAGEGHYSFGRGPRMPSPRISLLGPTTAATHFAARGPLLVFGIGLRPAGWGALVREDASLHANRVEDAAALFGAALERAFDALCEAPCADAMADIADAAMRALALAGKEPPFWFTRIADAWLADEASPQVDRLIAEAGISARQIERLAQRIYGASPKLLARKYRALRAATRLSRDASPWMEAAGDAFYDQSHFIREFKHFTGLTPGRFQKDPPPVTRLTLEGRRLLANPPTLGEPR